RIPELPYELERQILELSARAHPKHAPQLALVSRYVQIWVEAVIYETIVLGGIGRSKQDLFWSTLSLRPPNFFSKNVRHLHLTSGVSYTRARHLISVCTNLSTLTCWAKSSQHQRGAALRRLSIDADMLWPRNGPNTVPDLTHPVFASLTHLEIVNPRSGFDWSPLLDGSVPHLTHLAMGDLEAAHAESLIPFFCDALASEDPRLELIIAVSRSEHFLDALALAPDLKDTPRFVCLPSYHHPLGPTEYWEGVSRREVEFWSRRDAISSNVVSKD
ncbi:hypothetical protein B0H14DRAFT_2341367, partial [Mycena olivaceomarginata]